MIYFLKTGQIRMLPVFLAQKLADKHQIKKKKMQLRQFLEKEFLLNPTVSFIVFATAYEIFRQV